MTSIGFVFRGCPAASNSEARCEAALASLSSVARVRDWSRFCVLPLAAWQDPIAPSCDKEARAFDSCGRHRSALHEAPIRGQPSNRATASVAAAPLWWKAQASDNFPVHSTTAVLRTRLPSSITLFNVCALDGEATLCLHNARFPWCGIAEQPRLLPIASPCQADFWNLDMKKPIVSSSAEGSNRCTSAASASVSSCCVLPSGSVTAPAAGAARAGRH